MAHIERRQRKLKNGSLGPVRWRARYRDIDGRERSETFARRKDAERFLERNGARLQDGDWIDPDKRRTAFADWAELWWRTTVKLQPNTRRGYWLLLHNHVLPAFGGRRIGTISYTDVESFISSKLEAGLGAKHVREMVNVLSLIMNTAVRANAIRANPAAGHKLHVRRRRISQAAMLTMEQAGRLVAHTSSHYQRAMWLLIYTGMRPAEMCGLRVSDLDLGRHLLQVGPTLSPIAAFDGNIRQHVDGPPKSEAGNRPIPLPGWLCEALAEDLKSRPGGAVPDDHLILNRRGQPVNRDTFRARVVRPALHKAGLPDVFRTYDIRHTHASLLIDDGANVLAISERMGHTDPAITLRVYGHLFEGAQKELTERLDRRRNADSAVASQRPIRPVSQRRRGPRMGRGGPRNRGSEGSETDRSGS